jgi:hypothetical protein
MNNDEAFHIMMEKTKGVGERDGQILHEGITV